MGLTPPNNNLSDYYCLGLLTGSILLTRDIPFLGLLLDLDALNLETPSISSLIVVKGLILCSNLEFMI